jgi:hypothetical protein
MVIRSRAWFFVLACFGGSAWQSACAESTAPVQRPSVSTPPPTSSPPETVTDASDTRRTPDENDASATGEPPRFRHCVLHAGGGKGARSSDGGETASCWFNAECIAMPGQAAPGDGFVDLACDGLRCECELRHASGELPPYRFSFDIPELCKGDVAKKLLVSRCMANMPDALEK